jgi:tRNA 2-thiouridine synthesizing protein A
VIVLREDIEMAEIKVDVSGETCPVPLVETRKALRKAEVGDIVEVKGTHPASKKEIPMAVKALGLELVDVEEKDGVWMLRIRK